MEIWWYPMQRMSSFLDLLKYVGHELIQFEFENKRISIDRPFSVKIWCLSINNESNYIQNYFESIFVFNWNETDRYIDCTLLHRCIGWVCQFDIIRHLFLVGLTYLLAVMQLFENESFRAICITSEIVRTRNTDVYECIRKNTGMTNAVSSDQVTKWTRVGVLLGLNFMAIGSKWR